MVNKNRIAMATDNAQKRTSLLEEEPDLIDRIFDYLVAEVPTMRCAGGRQLTEMKKAVRAEFSGSQVYLRKRPTDLAHQVLRHFNGRNASEVARRLGISKATVYRYLKQPGN